MKTVIFAAIAAACVSAPAFAQDAAPFTGPRAGVTLGYDNAGDEDGFAYGVTAGYDLALAPRITGGVEVSLGPDNMVKAFIRKSDISRDRAEQRPERFAVGDKVDARVTNIDKASRRVSVSIKALEMAEEKEAVEQYGSSDSGASLGDILGAALKGQDED